MRRRVIIIGLLMILLALSFGCAKTTKPGEIGAPVLQITPTSGKAGTAIAIYGAGFVPQENIRVEVVMDGISIGLGGENLSANESGAFSRKSNIPIAPVAKPGLYGVKATGDKGSLAVYPLEVLA